MLPRLDGWVETHDNRERPTKENSMKDKKYDLILNYNQFIIAPRIISPNKTHKPDLNLIQHFGTTSPSGLCGYRCLSVELTAKIKQLIDIEQASSSLR